MRRERAVERLWGAFARYSGAVGCALSIALGIYSYELKNAEASGALLVGLVGAAVAFQLEILAKISEKTRRGEEYSALLRNFEEHPWMLRTVSLSVDAATRCLDETRVPQFAEQVRGEFEDLNLNMQRLAQGHLLCRSGDNTLMMDRYEKAQSRVLGLSESADDTWWRSATGRHYLDLNRATTARGVKVERIFILDPTLPSIDDIIEENVQAGVETFVIMKADVPAELRLNLTLFDDVLGHEDHTNADGKTVEYLYTTNPSDLARLCNVFQRLRSLAVPAPRASSGQPLPAPGPPAPTPVPPSPQPLPPIGDATAGAR